MKLPIEQTCLPPGRTLNEAQKLILPYKDQSSNFLVDFKTGVGKCLGIDTPILMYDGTIKPVQDVVIGDLLMGPDSQPRRVKSLARGREEMFRITPKRGGPAFECNASHILPLKLTPAYKGQQQMRYDVEVKQFINETRQFKHRAKLWRAGVEFSTQNVPVDPYFLGIWLGDGSRASLSVTTMDSEIVDTINATAKDWGLRVRVGDGKSTGKARTYYMVSDNRTSQGYGTNSLWGEVRKAMNSDRDKQVPSCYKINSRTTRLELLAGLLDSDGYRSPNRNSFEISTKFKTLADDICFIARSLGFTATVNYGKKRCTNTNVWGFYHRICISGFVDEIPVRLARKRVEPIKRLTDNTVTGFDVESIGEGDYYGFEIEGPDRLFLLGDFMVTHNTVIGNILSYKHLYGKNKKKVIYIAPMKALVEQMKNDWLDEKHPYSKLKLEIVTGDYVQVWENDKTLAEADIIVTTPESFTSRMRNIKAQKSRFLDDVGLIWVDEIHLLGEVGRGVNLEAGLMEFTSEYPNIPILGTSGTMPNAEQLGGWLTKLNGLETVVIQSDYRPVPLEIQFIPIGTDREGVERARIIDRITKQHPEAQMIIGVAAKAFGRKLATTLNTEYDIHAEFHNADRSKQDRNEIERKLQSGQLKHLITTKTLFAGINSPVEIVVCTAIKNAGGDIPAAEIQQMIGRAGRQGYSDKGWAYICIPSDQFEYHRQRIIKGEDVLSGFRTVNDVALHFLGAMYIGRINHRVDFPVWYQRTLRHHQQPMLPAKMEVLLNEIIEHMVIRGMIDEEPCGKLVLKRRGIIAAQMGIDPYYLFELIQNMQKYLAYENPSDARLAMALGNCSTFHAPIYSSGYEWEQVPKEIKALGLNTNYVRAVSAYYFLLKGEFKAPDFCTSMSYTVKQDIERMGFALERLNGECEFWRDDRIPLIPWRVYYGAKWDEARLMNQGLSHAAAKRCLKADIKNVSELKKYPDLAKELLTVKQRKKIGINE